MAQRYQDPLTDHEYDGIREFDNPTPGWWHGIFLASVMFGIVYFVFWEYSPLAYSIQEAHAMAQLKDQQKKFAKLGELKADQATILRMMGDADWMRFAASSFRMNCVTCHGASGQGEVGPNLTDDSYKNVKVITDLPKVISDGANNGAMPSWKNRLHPNEVVLLASYVASLRGGKLSGPRGVEGDEIAPWPKAPAAVEAKAGQGSGPKP